MDSQPHDLDGEELLSLAIEAAGRSRHDLAISYLKEALRADANDALALYFLGVEHAQIGLHDRALAELAHAVSLASDLHIARLQLGMLQLTSALPQDAAATLRPLTELGDDNFYSCFARGLLHLMRDEFAACRRWLRAGIALDPDNRALNGDMQRVLDALPAEAAATPNEAATADAGSFWLSAYAQAPAAPRIR
ncbi:hypothetical protein [Ramlibacter sp.]|uniref:hypothetical protein n=1 Tax=Ramlibacter sp. TaxID=1917967 RepID=UPI003D099A31